MHEYIQATTCQTLESYAGKGRAAGRPLEVLVELQPANGTRYTFSVTQLLGAARDATSAEFVVCCGLFGLGRAGLISRHEAITPRLCETRLGVESHSCAIVMACAIGAMIGRRPYVSEMDAYKHEIGNCLTWLRTAGFAN